MGFRKLRNTAVANRWFHGVGINGQITLRRESFARDRNQQSVYLCWQHSTTKWQSIWYNNALLYNP